MLKQGIWAFWFLNEININHWDIKADNIFIDFTLDPNVNDIVKKQDFSSINVRSKFVIKLIDFGVAKNNQTTETI